MIDEYNPVLEFTAEARCDACGAQAYCVAERGGRELMFCVHHRTQHGPRLLDEGWKITSDESSIEALAPGLPVLVR